MFSSRGEDDKNFDRGGPGGNISNKLSMLPQRYTPDHSKRVWKVYHERQALLQVDRQCSRPVFVDPLVWGKLSAEKLTALIEKERKRSMRFVIGRAGKRCFLTDRVARSHAGGASEVDASERSKLEFTADFFGAKGDFHQVNNGRYYGFETRSAESGGPAADRAKVKTIFKEGKANKAGLKDYENPVATREGAPLWQGGTFAGKAASALSASGVNNRGEFSGNGKKGRLETHPLPKWIGPGTHRLVFEEVERVRERTMTGKYDFSDRLVAHKLKDSLVATKELDGEKEGTKLQGTEVMERRGMDHVRSKEGFAERVSRRLKDAYRGGKTIYSGSCSMVAFEDLYIRATQVAQALPTVERTMRSKEERRLKARASEEIEIKSSGESSVGIDPNSEVLVVRLRSSSGGKAGATGAGAVGDDDSVTCTFGKPDGNVPNSSLRQGWWRTSRKKTLGSSTAVVTPDRPEERSQDRSGQAGSSFGAFPVTAFVRVRPWRKGWRKNIMSGRTRGTAGEGPGLKSVADSVTERSTEINAFPDLGLLILASERGRWRRKGGGGKIMEKYCIPHWLFSRKQSQSMELEERTALLIEACEWGDVKALQRLLQLGASPLDPYYPGVNGSRCVLCQFFMFLLQVGAGIRPRLAPDDALHEQVLEELMRSRLDRNSKFLSSGALQDDDDRGFSLLHHAAAFGNVRKAEFLLQRGIDPDIRAKGVGETALMVATLIGRRDHIRVADALLRAGADLSAEDNKGMTALHQAVFSGSHHMCLYLLLVGADRDARDHSGRTPVEICRRDAHPKTYALLQGFAPCQPPPPRVILDYMEKVEVNGVEVGTALDQMRDKKD